MPKSKVRKKTAEASRERVAAQSLAKSTVKVAGPSSPIYIGVMLALMVIGLVWLVVYYLWGQNIPFLAGLGNWNFAIGFALMIVGLLMTMRWR